MPFESINPSVLLGAKVDAVIVGWHSFEGERSLGSLYIRANGEEIEAYTAGSGELVLRLRPVPGDFSMGEFGSYEFQIAGPEVPASRLAGQTIRAVERVEWRETVVGYRFGTSAGPVVVLNVGDELVTSHGALPPDYADALVT